MIPAPYDLAYQSILLMGTVSALMMLLYARRF
jgi:hypothetical protein